MREKDALKSVSMRPGAPFVTIFGVRVMPVWPVGSLDSHSLVQYVNSNVVISTDGDLSY